MIRGIYAIIVLDLKRALLDRARLVAGLAQPMLYLFVLGAGLGGNTSMAAGYQQFIFPGVIGLTLLFTSVFCAITIVFDRQIGFFKAVLVAPLPRAALAFGKILSGGIQAFVQALLILPFAPFAGVHFTFASFFELVAAMLVAGIVFSAMGVAVAARFTSTTVFPIVSNAVILPMFFLSGALYPLQKAPHWLFLAAHCDPVAYAVDLMRGAIFGHQALPVTLTRFAFNPWVSMGALSGFCLVLAALSVRIFNRGEDDSSLGAAKIPWRR